MVVRKKAKEDKTIQPEKKSRAVYKCDEKLAVIIKGVNYLPKNSEEIGNELLQLVTSLSNEKGWLMENKKNGELFFKTAESLLDTTITRFMYYPHFDFDSFGLAYRRFSQLTIAKEVFLEIIQVHKNIEGYIEEIVKEGYPNKKPEFYEKQKDESFKRDVEARLSNISLKVSLIDFRHWVKESGNQNSDMPLVVLVKWLSSDDPHYDRIRACKYCNKIFWANYKNSYTCSETCRTISRHRDYRDLNKEEINKQRRKNYYYNNKIPYCEKCIRPNTKCNCYLEERSKNKNVNF